MKYIPLVKQSIQIIGGKYRRKKINFPDIPNLRPTASRIRETIFNWLMQDIRGAVCLDGFAGSGALGFEAVSRGAQSVTLVEKIQTIYNALQKTAMNFADEEIKIINSELEKFLINTTTQFDIIFFDPPFSLPFPMQCINLIENRQVLRKNGLLYIEFKNSVQLNSANWELLKSKSSGQVAYELYKKVANEK